jgi:hypothetical protein
VLVLTFENRFREGGKVSTAGPFLNLDIGPSALRADGQVISRLTASGMWVRIDGSAWLDISIASPRGAPLASILADVDATVIGPQATSFHLSDEGLSVSEDDEPFAWIERSQASWRLDPDAEAFSSIAIFETSASDIQHSSRQSNGR